MKIQNSLKKIAFYGCLLSMIYSCGGSTPTESNTDTAKKGNPEVRISEMSDLDGMNPLLTKSGAAEYIQNNLFQKLLKYDPKTLELVPQLAVKLPVVTPIDKGDYAGGMSLSYEINPKAKWPNGTAITADDYIFTIKTIKNPKVNATSLRSYFQFIDDIKVDSTNPQKFVIYSKERYFKAEESSGQISFILPEYHYDAEGIMRQFTIPQLNELSDELKQDISLNRFAELFNAPKFNREAQAVLGSGPYTLKEWTTGERVVLVRKKDWWGDQVEGNKMLEAYPPKITYRIFTDLTTAITNAKDGQIDVLRSISPNEYTSLKENSKFSANFDMSTPNQFAYHYIAFNGKMPQLADKRVRRALAHLVNRDDMIQSIFDGLAIKTNSPINPRQDYYNKDLKDIEYNLEKAKELLTLAGWKDTDGDNILDKVVGGKKLTMRLQYKYTQGNLIRKNIGNLLKYEAERVGIKIDLVAMNFAKLLEDADNKNFELLALAWINTPGLDDLKQVWHSSSIESNGNNRVSFKSAEADQLIDKIRVTLDKDKRAVMYKRIQEIIYEEQPCVFLFVPTECIAIHNRFEGIGTSPMRPGYTESWFKLRK